MTDITLANFCFDTTKAFGDVTGSFTTLVDMGTDYIFRGFLLFSSFNQSVIIKFANSELLIPEKWSINLDNFRHNDLIEIKHAGATPTEGFLKAVSWRAE